MKTGIKAAVLAATLLGPVNLLAIPVVMSRAHAQAMHCYSDGANTSCYGQPSAPAFGDSFASGFLRGQAVASQYAMVNAYREAHGLPRCHYGILGALMSASDGRPMC